MSPENEKKKPWPASLIYAFGASQFGFFVAAGLMAGLWLDSKWKTTPIFGFIGIVAGFATGIKLLIELVKKRGQIN